MAALTPDERAAIRQRISAALCNLGEFRLFWSPQNRCVIARSTSAQRRFRLPEDAVPVGQYVHGIGTRDILGDLEELLDRLAPPPAR